DPFCWVVVLIGIAYGWMDSAEKRPLTGCGICSDGSTVV
ncbi:hypothetical protein CSUI_008856, partial [Cystoisospora suis]